MRVYEGLWLNWLREQPPAWPRRHDEREWERQPRDRAREPFEDGAAFEPYPGATVLEDLQDTAEEAAMLRILARYTVIRVLMLATAGRLAGPKLLTERRVAMEHLALLPKPDWERHALERLTQICSERLVPSVVDAVLMAAECAAKRDQPMGAFALYREGYDGARRRGWWDLAARAAAGIARVAELQEARVSTRVWRWRARVLAERVRRAEAGKEAGAEAGTEAAPSNGVRPSAPPSTDGRRFDRGGAAE